MGCTVIRHHFCRFINGAAKEATEEFDCTDKIRCVFKAHAVSFCKDSGRVGIISVGFD